MKKIHSSYYRFFLLLVIMVVIGLLKEEASLVRTLLYVAAGSVLTAKIRQEKVVGIEYFALILLVYVDLSLFIPFLIPVRSIVNTILKTGGLYGIIHFLTGALIGYIIIPASKNDNRNSDSGVN